MLLRQLSRFLVAVLPMCAFAACSDQSHRRTSRRKRWSAVREAERGYSRHVHDAVSADAKRPLNNPGRICNRCNRESCPGGSAVFQFCATRGKPAPSAVCNSGSGRWARVGTAGIISGGTEVGHALRVYDPAPQSVGTTIGFRFKYLSDVSGIANGVSAGADHTF
jgi:hypothetical protein